MNLIMVVAMAFFSGISGSKLADVAAVGTPDDRYGERVCVYVVLREGTRIDLGAISDHFRAAGVARQKTPERLVIVDHLPRTAAGKVQKFVLREAQRQPVSGSAV